MDNEECTGVVAVARRLWPATVQKDEGDAAPNVRWKKELAFPTFRPLRQEEIVKKSFSLDLREGAGMSYLVEKLIAQNEKLQGMQELLDDLCKELAEARDISRKDYLMARPGSCCITVPGQNAITSQHEICAASHFQEELPVSLVSEDGPYWSSAEMQVWKAASLSQLFSMRKKLFSSLYGVSDAITRKTLDGINVPSVLKDAQQETDSVIQAAMHRLLGEAFYVSSLQDVKDFFTLAESLTGTGVETFDRALLEIQQLTENWVVLNSCEKFQAFLRRAPSSFTPSWRDRYLDAMRNLLVAFAVNSRGAELLNARREELERITQQEMIHAAFLRAAQGQDVISQVPLCCVCSSGLPIKRSPEPETRRHLLERKRVCAPKAKCLVFDADATSGMVSPRFENGRRCFACSLKSSLNGAKSTKDRALLCLTFSSGKRSCFDVAGNPPTRRWAAKRLQFSSRLMSPHSLYQTPEALRLMPSSSRNVRMNTPGFLSFGPVQTFSADDIQKTGKHVSLTVFSRAEQAFPSSSSRPDAWQYTVRNIERSMLTARSERREDGFRSPDTVMARRCVSYSRE
ncbi:hypothetical protein MOQ_002850 [Trypanosoma cruzi marinkellei]|uniref:Uncharacterized protein n=1 Tax=Trypanosoma cruzi marinkellei TaxID=85056 RepID=K2NWJ1_TRYCR|nr:hypothetical protein MOQ_002850 [Trypanosoma cruzi marinkellei]